ncbi:Vacuolar segregation subunit 7 [Penicillium brevicompactum]|uniref:Vacuolar segregation subunit 7 n=1 Tax=Penicillium brevicompactum TaxID=5074 RepID=A0A9W9RVX5_PENBR|nr:Vacuolar segregation subunit 7 [Penicillium brevicompactum]
MAAEPERPPRTNGTSGRSRGVKDADAASDPVQRSANETAVNNPAAKPQVTSQVPWLSPNIPAPSTTASTTNSAVSSRESSPVRFSSRTLNSSSHSRVSSQSRKPSQDRASPARHHSSGPNPGHSTHSPSASFSRSSSSPVKPLVLSASIESANVASPEKNNMPSWAANRRTELESTLPNTSHKRSTLPADDPTKVDRNAPRPASRTTGGQGSSLETVDEMTSNPSTPSSGTAPQPVTPEESRLHRIDEDPTPRAPQQPQGSGSDSGENKVSETKEEPRPQTSAPAKTPRTLIPQRSTTSLSAGARGKPADGSVRNMTVETETVSSIPQVSLGVGNGERGNASRSETGTLRMKPSTETIRPRKDKKKGRRANALTAGPASSKADIFEAKVANAVDEADVSDSDETFVYESNPPDPYPNRPPRYHSRTPSATSMVSQVDQLSNRTRGLRDASHGVIGKRSMKFTGANNSIDGGIPDLDGAPRSSRTDGNGTITPRHHNIGSRHHSRGMQSVLDSDTYSQPGPHSQKSPRHFIGTPYRQSRHSSTRMSPNHRMLNGFKKGGEYGSSDYEAEGADDERTPLVGNRSVRSRNGGRRPNSASLRQMEYMAQRHRGMISRFGSCAVIFVLLLIVAGGATSFIVAATQPLLDVQVIAIQNVLASEQELMLDLNVQAVNPNLFPVTIDDTDVNIFAKSGYVGTDKFWRDHGAEDLDNFPRIEQSRRRWQLSQAVRCMGSVNCLKEAMGGHSNPHTEDGVDKGTDPPSDPEGDPKSMLLGRVFRFDSPLSFESSPWSHRTSSSKGQIRLSRPGNKTETGGTERWERVLQHPFELTVRGIVKYQLPLSSRYLSASISSSIKVVPDAEDPDTPGNSTARITAKRTSTLLPLDARSAGSRRPFTA